MDDGKRWMMGLWCARYELVSASFDNKMSQNVQWRIDPHSLFVSGGRLERIEEMMSTPRLVALMNALYDVK